MKKVYLKWIFICLGFSSLLILNTFNYLIEDNETLSSISYGDEEQSFITSLGIGNQDINHNPYNDYSSSKTRSVPGEVTNPTQGSSGSAGFLSNSIKSQQSTSGNNISSYSGNNNYATSVAGSSGGESFSLEGGFIAFSGSRSKEDKTKKPSPNQSFGKTSFGGSLSSNGGLDQITEVPTYPEEVPLDNGFIFIIFSCMALCFYQLFYKPYLLKQKGLSDSKS